MKVVTFVNFTTEEFLITWDGQPRRFKPGERARLPAGVAAVFAKHLANRELLKDNKENSTSPKNPEQVPQFMDLYNQAYIDEGAEERREEDATAEMQDDLSRAEEEAKLADAGEDAPMIGGNKAPKKAPVKKAPVKPGLMKKEEISSEI